MDMQNVHNVIATLRKMDHDQKANTIQTYVDTAKNWEDEAVLYKEEVERLLKIFKKLDVMYQPHDKNIPNHKGLLDSPVSLLINTRDAIDTALNKE